MPKCDEHPTAQSRRPALSLLSSGLGALDLLLLSIRSSHFSIAIALPPREVPAFALFVLIFSRSCLLYSADSVSTPNNQPLIHGSLSRGRFTGFFAWSCHGPSVSFGPFRFGVFGELYI